jgi:hypothetical protein
VIDHDSHALARQHTAQLLQMLRGYGPVPELSEPERAADPLATVDPTPDAVAKRSSAYVWLLKTPSRRMLPLEPSSTPTHLSLLHPHGHSVGEELGMNAMPGSITAVGQRLRHSAGVLGRLVAKADEMNRLSHLFRTYLPPHLHDHVVLIRLDREAWEVRADSASWATRLRYALPNIRPLLSEQLGVMLPKPRVYTVPAAAPRPPHQRLRLTLTQRNAELLEATARSLLDARLVAALRRLAANAQSTLGSVEKSSCLTLKPTPDR